MCSVCIIKSAHKDSLEASSMSSFKISVNLNEQKSLIWSRENFYKNNTREAAYFLINTCLKYVPELATR